MLYRDYSRPPGEWIANAHGGRENLEAASLLKELNRAVYAAFPDVQTIAEESTSWPMVSRPTNLGGLGFGLKWDLGWMHDSLTYLRRDPVHRSHHHNELTFRSLYAAHENFVLPLSHDEVVHGKGSLLGKMPGDAWQRFANLRLLLAMLYAQTGKKLLFMGGELGQPAEWHHDISVGWDLLESAAHQGVQHLVRDLNHAYRTLPSLHQLDCDTSGLHWVEANDNQRSVLAFERLAVDHERRVLCVFNFTPTILANYRVGVERGGFWREVINTDALSYGGSGVGNLGGLTASDKPCHGRRHSLSLTLPPLGAVYLQRSE